MIRLFFLLSFSILCLSFCKDNTSNLCPGRCPLGARCVEWECRCEGALSGEEYRVINKKWCERIGAFIGCLEEWYCVDTFTVWIEPPGDVVPDILPNTWARFINRRDFEAGFLGTHPIQQSVFYYRSLKGDSIYIPEIPLSSGNNIRFCDVFSDKGGVCFIDLHGKFVSNDTIEGFLRVRCDDGARHPMHDDRKPIVLTRVH